MFIMCLSNVKNIKKGYLKGKEKMIMKQRNKNILLCMFLIVALFCCELLPSNVYAYDESTAITSRVLADGQKYADEMNKKNSMTRMDEEVWTLVGDPMVLCGTDAITGDFGRFVAIGQTLTETMSYSISAGYQYKGFTVEVGFSGSKTESYNGPNDGTKIANGKPATHRAFFTIVTGKLVKYTYRVTQKYSGAYIRTETRTMFEDKKEKVCSALVYSPSTSIYFNNADENKTKYLANYSTYIAQFSKKGPECDDYYNF